MNDRSIVVVKDHCVTIEEVLYRVYQVILLVAQEHFHPASQRSFLVMLNPSLLPCSVNNRFGSGV
jgi:hypothetical protein